VLTCIMWLAQSLRYIDFIANKGVPILLFFKMIFFLLPNMTVIVIPIAVLIGVLFIYNKLTTDHEIIVMQASGVSYWQLAKPALLISLVFTCISYIFTLYFLPMSFRKYRDITMALREKSLTNLVSAGQFNSMGRYTVYARTRDGQGNFLGLIVYDGTAGEKSITFMAEKGIVFNKQEGGQLLLINGNRQEKDLKTSKPSILYFDRYVIEAKDKSAQTEPAGRFLRAYERHIPDLLNPQESLSPSMRLEFIAAASQRLLSPLYTFAFGLLGVCMMLLGSFNRKGRFRKIMMACVIASIIEISSMIFLHTLKYLTVMIYLSYAILFLFIIICLLLLSPWMDNLLNIFRRQKQLYPQHFEEPGRRPSGEPDERSDLRDQGRIPKGNDPGTRKGKGI